MNTKNKRKFTYKHIYFEQHEPIDKRKTQLWYCYNKKHESLGEISWYAPWRKYVIKIEDPILFCSECLRDIADFLDLIKNNRR